jgi:WhiB family transcriptional regulator, redox-sensing transcriptional regulator
MIANWNSAGEDWRIVAACRNVDPKVFFPQSDLFSNRAKLICSTCPVREQCLAWAMATDQLHGVWGGKTAKERRRMGVPAKSLDRPRDQVRSFPDRLIMPFQIVTKLPCPHCHALS